MVVQAVLFPIKKFTTNQARKYLLEHNHKAIKRVHKSRNFFRYRLVEPKKKDKYISKKNKNGIIYVIKV